MLFLVISKLYLHMIILAKLHCDSENSCEMLEYSVIYHISLKFVISFKLTSFYSKQADKYQVEPFSVSLVSHTTNVSVVSSMLSGGFFMLIEIGLNVI